MSFVEIAGIVVGLTGLATVFDTTCLIWRTIAEASDYGDDVANLMSKIEMEYFRFQAWWTTMESFAADPRIHSQSSTRAMSMPQTKLISQLHTNMENPLLNAAYNFLQLLEELQGILIRSKALAAVTQAPARLSTNQQVPASSNTDSLNINVSRFRQRQKALAKDLLQSVSWWKRVKHDATPWKESDKQRMIEIHKDMVYWRESMNAILPQKLRESVVEQGIAGYLLDSEDKALAAPDVSQQASSAKAAIIEYRLLIQLRERTRAHPGQKTSDDVQKIFREMKQATNNLPDMPHQYDEKQPLSVLTLVEARNVRSKVLVEWYRFPPGSSGIDTLNLARERIARLSYLLRKESRPDTLRSLNTRGYVENTEADSFGLILEIPDWASDTMKPLTLNQMLSRKLPAGIPKTLPTLERKYELAVALASNLYTFMLTHWHHKRYHSGSVFFLFSRNADTANVGPTLSQPFIGGYIVSRPDDPKQDTYTGMPAAEAEMYFHPRLRVTEGRRPPRFEKSFDIYSFGILLAEIGFWGLLSKLVPTSTKLEPTKLRESLIDKCKSDLACWMGERYRDVTLQCLRAEMTDDGGIGEDLNDFYWHVVLELIKCAPSE